MIDKLTPEQEALIPVYREKWRNIAFSTKPIDREKAIEAIKAAYNFLEEKEPEVIVCDSPYTVWDVDRLEQIQSEQKKELFNELIHFTYIGLYKKHGKEYCYSQKFVEEVCLKLDDPFWYQLGKRLENHFCSEQWKKLWMQLLQKYKQIGRRRGGELGKLIVRRISNCIQPEIFAYLSCRLDFWVSVLNYDSNLSQWLLCKELVQNCGWIFPFEGVCFVCDRPRKLSFDSQQRLHAEGEPAVQYADGYSLYSYHGVTLPEKYGKVHPQQWKSQWLLEEDNAELRRVLLQGIGYDRVCEELQAIELDIWKEYTLLKIASDVDIEPVYLLKMTCPSTGFIHALRVPPNLTAREAIAWVNWDIDPEDFSIQT